MLSKLGPGKKQLDILRNTSFNFGLVNFREIFDPTLTFKHCATAVAFEIKRNSFFFACLNVRLYDNSASFPYRSLNLKYFGRQLSAS